MFEDGPAQSFPAPIAAEGSKQEPIQMTALSEGFGSVARTRGVESVLLDGPHSSWLSWGTGWWSIVLWDPTLPTGLFRGADATGDYLCKEPTV